MITTPVQIDQLWVPDSLLDEDAADFLVAAEGARPVRVQAWAQRPIAYTPEELLQAFNDPYERLTVLVATMYAHIVGRAEYPCRQVDNNDLAVISREDSAAVPERRRRHAAVAGGRALCARRDAPIYSGRSTPPGIGHGRRRG